MKHTEGNWEISKVSEEDGDYTIYSDSQDSHRDLCRVNGNRFFSAEEGEANANLIAAAPELLEALKQIIHSVEHEGYSGRVGQSLIQANEAIKKATP